MYRVQPVDNDCCIELFNFWIISEYFTLFLNTSMKITYYSSGTPNDFPSVPTPPIFSFFLFHSFSLFVNASYPSFLHLRSKKKILRKINVILAKRISIENQALQVRIKVTHDHCTRSQNQNHRHTFRAAIARVPVS